MKKLIACCLLLNAYAFAENCTPIKDIKINALGGYSTIVEYSNNLAKSISEETQHKVSLSNSDGLIMDFLRSKHYDQTTPVTIKVRFNEAQCEDEISEIIRVISELRLAKNISHKFLYKSESEIYQSGNFYDDVYIDFYQDFKVKKD